MWYLIKSVEDKIKHRSSLMACERCGSYYPKTQSECPHCYAMGDEDVLRLLARKKYFRISLGRGMLLFAVIILLLMYIFIS